MSQYVTIELNILVSKGLYLTTEFDNLGCIDQSDEGDVIVEYVWFKGLTSPLSRHGSTVGCDAKDFGHNWSTLAPWLDDNLIPYIRA